MAKVLIWLASGEKGKLEAGIMYGVNARKYGWVEEVQFVVFGPAEEAILQDEALFTALHGATEPVYCKAFANQRNLTVQLESKGVRLEYVGQSISDFINAGYQVLTF